MALHPDTTIRANLGALLIAHFRRQSSDGAGDIRIGGLVTQICIAHRIPIPQVEPVAGPKTMDRNFCISAKKIGKYLANPNYRAFQFTFEPHGPVQQELLPFPQAFSLAGRNSWVLSEEEMHNARALAGRVEGEEDPAWEGGEEQP